MRTKHDGGKQWMTNARQMPWREWARLELITSENEISPLSLVCAQIKILCICTLGVWVLISTLLPGGFIYVKLSNTATSKQG